MATANTVQLHLGNNWPEYYREGITSEATEKASALLQENHDKHHIFFNSDGFHNHIAHHLLTIWSLRATPDQLQKEYDSNENYQRPMMKPEDSVLQDLSDPGKFTSYLGPEKYYSDFLEFFHKEIEEKGWQNVLNEYVFAGDERANSMLVRMFAGFLHPIIHLGFGVEFQQPAIIAEALAQAACHSDWIGKLLMPAEEAANKRTDAGSKSIVQLIDEIHGDQVLLEAPKWSDGNKVRDGILARAADRMIDYAAQVKIKPEELEAKTAEMTMAAAYYTGGAQRSDRVVKFDFYFMHCVNCSIFFSQFLKQDWLSTENKVRLLEWKIRNDLAMYASRKSPEIRLDDIRNYAPSKPSAWGDVEDRVCAFDDDGHASKLVRAFAHGQRVCKPYEESDAFRLKHDDWLKLAHMAIDSVEQPGNNWVRSAGFDEAWENVPLRANL